VHLVLVATVEAAWPQTAASVPAQVNK